jgi:hypothetical protein
MQQASLVYATAKAFFSIPMAGVRLATSVGKMTANVASAMIYGAPAPGPTRPPSTRAAQQNEHAENEDERTTLLRTPENESLAGASPHAGHLLNELFTDVFAFCQFRHRHTTPANPPPTISQHSVAPITEYAIRRKAANPPSLVSQAVTALAVIPITFCVTGLAGGLLAITLVDSVVEACGLASEKPRRVLTMT